MSANKGSSNKLSKSALASLLLEKTSRTSALVPPVLQQVGKLAAGVASVCGGPINSGSATGNPRNKCALQPGHSLMDWIRLGSSGKDLTGVGPRAGQLSVTRHELSQHNKENDAWLAIRGKVYNITAYLPFHPGGPEEIMKGAGIDATSLFDQIHPWVNYDQILQKCLIGRLVSVDPGVDRETLFFGEQRTSPRKRVDADANANAVTSAEDMSTEPRFKPPEPTITQSVESTEFREPRIKFLEKYPVLSEAESTSREGETEEDSSPPLPRFDWIQRIDWITVFFYTKAFCNPLIEIFPPNSEKTIVISLTYDGTVFKNEIIFFDSVNWPCTIKMVCETGKVEMIFRKTEGRIWDNYGVLRQQSKTTSGVVNGVKFNFVLTDKTQVNHNIFLIKLERVDGARVVVPIGKHVRVFANIDGQEMSRSYTPVPQSLFTGLALNEPCTDSLCLMIKRYEAGNVSRFLTDREKNDVIHVTKPTGDFELIRIEKRETFILLAAGTGITPMLALLVFLLERRVKKCQFIRLLFFNKTEQDIPFKEQLENLEMKYSKLKINHILSEPDENWTGLTGHVNKEMIDNAIQEHIKDTGYTISHIFCFVCGPNPFVALSIRELQQLGVDDNQIHAFQG